LFATISGAHLYGFPSPDSDYDLRGGCIRARGQPLPELPSDQTHNALNDLLVRFRIRQTG